MKCQAVERNFLLQLAGSLVSPTPTGEQERHERDMFTDLKKVESPHFLKHYGINIVAISLITHYVLYCTNLSARLTVLCLCT